MTNNGGTTSIVQEMKAEKFFRPLEELNLIDNFLFQTIVSQEEDGEEFCKIMLKTILGKQIRKVRVVPQKSILGIDTNQHGIRLDAYIEDVSDEAILPGGEMADAKIAPDIYDIEPNNDYEKKTLPKRMRYYHGLIDTQLLNTGVEYDRLPKVVIIVILPYDPFGQKRMVYTVKNQCVEDAGILYEDGATKIFLYTKGTEGNPSQSLRDMLKYMEDTTAKNITNEDIHTVHEFVEKAKHRKEVGINYMKIWEEKYLMRKEALAEGHEEGFKRGLEEGREEGLKQGLEEGLKQGLEEGIGQGIGQGIEQGIEQGMQVLVELCQETGFSQKETADRLRDKFSVSEEAAKEKVKKYWKETC